MSIRNRIIGWTFLVIALSGFMLILTKLIRVESSSDEGRLMAEACHAIRQHENLRAEQDFDQIIEIIASHLHSYRDQSDTLVARAILDLRKMREEVVFRNNDLEMYNRQFAQVLNQLSYMELEDAIALMDQGEIEAAKGALKEARHYLQDALSFSKNPNFQNELELLNDLDRLDKGTLSRKDLEKSLEKVRKHI